MEQCQVLNSGILAQSRALFGELLIYNKYIWCIHVHDLEGAQWLEKVGELVVENMDAIILSRHKSMAMLPEGSV